jgi:RimJ/RimL family protein N-acetyltransferase
LHHLREETNKAFKPLPNEQVVMEEDILSSFRTRNGRRITLRPLAHDDLNALVSFVNTFVREKERNRELGISSMDRKVTRLEERRFLERTLHEKAKRRLVTLAAFHGNRLIGHCDIAGRTQEDEMHTGVLGIAIVEGYRGVGLGERMVRIALDQASKLGIWVVELDVFDTNTTAKRLYHKLGFKTAGVVPKKVFRDGKFIDVARMYIHLPRHSPTKDSQANS